MSALSSLSGTAPTPLSPGDSVLVRARLGKINAHGLWEVIFTVGEAMTPSEEEITLSFHRSMLLGDSSLGGCCHVLTARRRRRPPSAVTGNISTTFQSPAARPSG